MCFGNIVSLKNFFTLLLVIIEFRKLGNRLDEKISVYIYCYESKPKVECSSLCHERNLRKTLWEMIFRFDFSFWKPHFRLKKSHFWLSGELAKVPYYTCYRARASFKSKLMSVRNFCPNKIFYSLSLIYNDYLNARVFGKAGEWQSNDNKLSLFQNKRGNYKSPFGQKFPLTKTFTTKMYSIHPEIWMRSSNFTD